MNDYDFLINKMSKDELVAQQTFHLKNVLNKVYDRVAYYKNKFDRHGVHPSDFKEIADLKKFPYTDKEDLRKNYPFGMFAEPQKNIVRVHASSGTTGKSTIVGYTKNDVSVWADLVARSIYVSGGRPGDKILVSYGYGLFTGGLGAHYGGEKLGCLVIPMSGGNTEKQIQLIEDLKPDIIMVTPSYLLNIIEVMKSKNIDLAKLSLRIGILGAEPWSEKMRAKIEEELPLKAIDIYGLSEIIGPGVANEFSQEPGKLHFWEDHFYPEIVEPEKGIVLPEGQEGELVITSLTKEAMPLIRYRTRDITELNVSKVSSFRTIDKILGRNDDALIIRGINVFPSQVEEILLEFEQVSPTYQIEVDKKSPLWKLIINVELLSSYHESVVENLVKKITKRIKEVIGISTVLKIKPAGTIPRSMGKAKRVIFH